MCIFVVGDVFLNKCLDSGLIVREEVDTTVIGPLSNVVEIFCLGGVMRT